MSSPAERAKITDFRERVNNAETAGHPAGLFSHFIDSLGLAAARPPEPMAYLGLVGGFDAVPAGGRSRRRLPGTGS